MKRFLIIIATLSLLSITFAAVGSEPQDKDTLSELTDQLIAGSVPVYTDSELDAMTESELYETAECYRLANRYWQERRTYKKLIEKYPETQHLTKAKLEIAKMCLYVDPNYKAAMAGFDVARLLC